MYIILQQNIGLSRSYYHLWIIPISQNAVQLKLIAKVNLYLWGSSLIKNVCQSGTMQHRIVFRLMVFVHVRAFSNRSFSTWRNQIMHWFILNNTNNLMKWLYSYWTFWLSTFTVQAHDWFNVNITNTFSVIASFE